MSLQGLDNFIREGQKLFQNKQNPSESHSSFETWVDSVGKWLSNLLPDSGLLGEWLSLKYSSLDEYDNWSDFIEIVRKRIEWLSKLPSQISKSDDKSHTEKTNTLKQLIVEVNKVSYTNRDSLDILIRRAKMFSKKFFGSESHYIEEINSLTFRPGSRKVSNAQGFDTGLQKFKNILAVILEDLSLDTEKKEIKISQKLPEKKIITKDFGYLESVKIKNYYSLKNVRLGGLADKKEIYILGENGDGKTFLLQSILLALKGNEDVGAVSDFIKETKTHMELTASDHNENSYKFCRDPFDQETSFLNVFGYGVNRHLSDIEQRDAYGYKTLFTSQNLNNPVQWLIKLHHEKLDKIDRHIPLEKAKEILINVLGNNVEIEVNSQGVAFVERGTKIDFSKLSEGYKTVIIWVCDLLQRLSENQPKINKIEDFQAIVLVDEIGLHLHPLWEYKIVSKLRRWFPKIQFIFSTHSPIVIMGSSEDAIYYKLYKEEGEVCVDELSFNISNLMINSIVTSPIFNLESARPLSFDEEKEELDTSDDYIYSMLHREVRKRIKGKHSNHKDMLQIVKEELDKYEASQKND